MHAIYGQSRRFRGRKLDGSLVNLWQAKRNSLSYPRIPIDSKFFQTNHQNTCRIVIFSKAALNIDGKGIPCITGSLMEVNTRSDMDRMSGDESERSFWNVLIDSRRRSVLLDALQKYAGLLAV
jgi:hypothetical protein